MTFVGATTENPSFEVNAALLSRASVHVLETLSEADLLALLERARARHCPELAFSDEARQRLVGFADGDGRRTLNLLEQVRTAAQTAGRTEVDGDFVEQALSRSLRRFDKGGEAFYDQISALHKSVRGSDPDAALYWLCRMLDGGADPFVPWAAPDSHGGGGHRSCRPARLADLPRRLRMLRATGVARGELALAQATIFMACAAKSNAVYKAYNAARKFVSGDGSRPVPMHLRNAPTRLMKDLGYGQRYRYAHDEPGAYAAGENYFPDGMSAPRWYQPTDRGMENRIAEKLRQLRALDDADAQRRTREE